MGCALFDDLHSGEGLGGGQRILGSHILLPPASMATEDSRKGTGRAGLSRLSVD